MQILVGKCKAKDLIKEITRVWLKNYAPYTPETIINGQN